MKNARHEQILQLIGVYDIETQEELAEKLNEKGFTVTQATVSRDIRQLQLRKVTGSDGKSHYTLGGGSQVDLSRKYHCHSHCFRYGDGSGGSPRQP